VKNKREAKKIKPLRVGAVSGSFSSDAIF